MRGRNWQKKWTRRWVEEKKGKLSIICHTGESENEEKQWNRKSLVLLIEIFTRVVPKVMSNFFFACELGTVDEGERGGKWNQLLCYP